MHSMLYVILGMHPVTTDRRTTQGKSMSSRDPKIQLATGRDLHFPTSIWPVAFRRSCCWRCSRGERRIQSRLLNDYPEHCSAPKTFRMPKLASCLSCCLRPFEFLLGEECLRGDRFDYVEYVPLTQVTLAEPFPRASLSYHSWIIT